MLGFTVKDPFFFAAKRMIVKGMFPLLINSNDISAVKNLNTSSANEAAFATSGFVSGCEIFSLKNVYSKVNLRKDVSLGVPK